MKILVIGGGGREHALVWKLAQSPHTSRILCAPGNAGIGAERVRSTHAQVQLAPIAADDVPALVAFGMEQRPDLTVVGPDNPLALGVVDEFENAGLRIWGPNRRAAQFEASKAFAQGFMERHGIPTARAGVFSDPASAKAFAEKTGGRCVVKADGLALGKGVLVCDSPREAKHAIAEIMEQRAFGDAGRSVVIQEFLEGPEVSLHALCDGRTCLLFPTAQDHKRIGDADTGPNTGGMGTYSPTPFLEAAALDQVRALILDRWLAGCAAEGIDYRGILYPGVMLTREGPKVLEFNARFGDPETQVYLARLESDLVEALTCCLDGRLAQHRLQWKAGAAVCVVMASEGYPGTYPKGRVIRGLDAAAACANSKVFHAGTSYRDGQWLTQGGRVLGVTAWGETLSRAHQAAYHAVSQIHFDGAHFRRDIAAKALVCSSAVSL